MKLLINKYLEGRTSGLEDKELYDWIQQNKKNKEFFKQEVFVFGLKNTTDEIFNSKEAFTTFRKHVKSDNVIKLKPTFFKKYYKYTAVAAILIFVSSFFLMYKTFINVEGKTDSTIIVESNEKQSDKIILTLNDGSTKIVKEDNEELSYIASKTEPEVLEYNELKVPRGQIFKIILSDSTVVWLNADTKLRYPKKFLKGSDSRLVFLEGEAFFDVTHNKSQPFIVNTNEVNVKVLGTKFNVSSYPNEEDINTTLVEGSVNVIDTSSPDNSVIILPSYQASFNKGQLAITSKKVNTTNFTAWMERRIIFNDISFEKLIDKIERTYNVDIENKNSSLNQERFTGQFDIEGVDVIFKSLSTSFYFEYEIVKNKITIKK